MSDGVNAQCAKKVIMSHPEFTHPDGYKLVVKSIDYEHLDGGIICFEINVVFESNPLTVWILWDNRLKIYVYEDDSKSKSFGEFLVGGEHKLSMALMDAVDSAILRFKWVESGRQINSETTYK